MVQTEISLVVSFYINSPLAVVSIKNSLPSARVLHRKEAAILILDLFTVRSKFHHGTALRIEVPVRSRCVPILVAIARL